LEEFRDHCTPINEYYYLVCKVLTLWIKVWTASTSPAYQGKRASLPSGHQASTFSAHIACDEHTTSGRCPWRPPRWQKTRLCFVVVRSGCGCGRAPAKNEVTDAASVPIQGMWLFVAVVSVLVLSGIALPLSSAGPLRTLLSYKREDTNSMPIDRPAAQCVRSA